MNLPRVPPARPPGRPTNALHTVSAGIGTVVGAPGQVVNLMNSGFATATSAVAQALPCFPAATLGTMAMGAPHAHTLHPPSGPPPIPPTPLPSFGPIMFGSCVQVLINGKPAARCGDLGLGPTCCGLPPIYEVFTGSSKVFIGGARAARAIDITYHCKPVPPAGTAARGARSGLAMAMKGMMIAGQAAQLAAIAGDAVESVRAEDDAALSAAMGLSAGMMAAQMANDLVAMAMGAMMGKDICVPPGTPGMVMPLNASTNVLIGGFPIPSWLAIARGLLKIVRGLRRRGAGRSSSRWRCPGC